MVSVGKAECHFGERLGAGLNCMIVMIGNTKTLVGVPKRIAANERDAQRFPQESSMNGPNLDTLLTVAANRFAPAKGVASMKLKWPRTIGEIGHTIPAKAVGRPDLAIDAMRPRRA
jgi:hypothetical protein